MNQDKLPLLDIDPVQIESVLVNIILNAFQAMEKKEFSNQCLGDGQLCEYGD